MNERKLNMSNNKNKGKSLAKDIGILLFVWVPLLFIIIGGLIWKNDGFDGTIMEKLFPALFFGFIAGFATLIFVSNVFRESTPIWVIATLLVFATTVALYLLELTTALCIVMGIPIALLLLLGLMKWIAGS
jgi:hypothetical protein